MGIFEPSLKGEEKKINKKKKSESTLFSTYTPKNAHMKRLNSINQNMKNMNSLQKTRKRQCKSERGSISHNSKDFIKKEIMDKIIESKAINSSLFLNREEEEEIVSYERVDDIQTSYSIILLKESLKNARKNVETPIRELEDRMAIRIQRAWREYKTKRIIR